MLQSSAIEGDATAFKSSLTLKSRSRSMTLLRLLAGLAILAITRCLIVLAACTRRAPKNTIDLWSNEQDYCGYIPGFVAMPFHHG